MSDPVHLYYHQQFLRHDAGPGHPERPARLEAIVERLRRDPVPGVTWREPTPASREAILRVHAAAHLDRLDDLRGHVAALDLDTAVSPGSVDAAYLAAGAAVEATEALVRGEAARAVALVRPPGHHAETDRAMGFCLLNNIAIAAAHALAALDCARVLILDWDVHHGNGTQHLFETRADVLFVSSHGNYNYPGTGRLAETGRGDGAGFTVNLPLPPGQDDATMVHLYREVLRPIAASYEPDLVLVSAGFDCHRDDPLGGMAMTADGFAALCGLVRDLAAEHAGGRIALLLEGGYDLNGLASSLHACVQVLAGRPAPDVGPPGAAARELVDALRRHHARGWPALEG